MVFLFQLVVFSQPSFQITKGSMIISWVMVGGCDPQIQGWQIEWRWVFPYHIPIFSSWYYIYLFNIYISPLIDVYIPRFLLLNITSLTDVPIVPYLSCLSPLFSKWTVFKILCYTGWLRTGFRSWIVIFLNIIGWYWLVYSPNSSTNWGKMSRSHDFPAMIFIPISSPCFHGFFPDPDVRKWHRVPNRHSRLSKSPSHHFPIFSQALTAALCATTPRPAAEISACCHWLLRAQASQAEAKETSLPGPEKMVV